MKKIKLFTFHPKNAAEAEKEINEFIKNLTNPEITTAIAAGGGGASISTTILTTIVVTIQYYE